MDIFGPINKGHVKNYKDKMEIICEAIRMSFGIVYYIRWACNSMVMVNHLGLALVARATPSQM